MAGNFQNGGALFHRQKKSPKAADYGGDFTLEGEVLDYVLRCVERNEQVKLDISGWQRQGRNNTNFISLSIEKPYALRQQGEQRGGYSSGSNQASYTPRQQGQQEQPRQQQPQQGYQQGQGQGRYQQPPQGQQRNTGYGNQPPQGRSQRVLDDDIPF